MFVMTAEFDPQSHELYHVGLQFHADHRHTNTHRGLEQAGVGAVGWELGWFLETQSNKKTP